ASRLDSRVDGEGRAVLLEDQDRSRWDRSLFRVACRWLERSRTATPTRYHYEAAIALEHCRAASVDATDWPAIVSLYDRLLALHASPLYVLNRAVARGQAGEVERALAEIESIRGEAEMRGYPLLDCAAGRLHELRGDRAAAAACYETALATTRASHERALIEEKLARVL
ncbi:MAG: DUF6596 domain-containing protein, partial [Thermoanaerobaculia bacterium]|nr:DUF6596 domain-containing protein [Thermoanaerobaculia bacterium]